MSACGLRRRLEWLDREVYIDKNLPQSFSLSRTLSS